MSGGTLDTEVTEVCKDVKEFVDRHSEKGPTICDGLKDYTFADFLCVLFALVVIFAAANEYVYHCPKINFDDAPYWFVCYSGKCDSMGTCGRRALNHASITALHSNEKSIQLRYVLGRDLKSVDYEMMGIDKPSDLLTCHRAAEACEIRGRVLYFVVVDTDGTGECRMAFRTSLKAHDFASEIIGSRVQATSLDEMTWFNYKCINNTGHKPADFL